VAKAAPVAKALAPKAMAGKAARRDPAVRAVAFRPGPVRAASGRDGRAAAACSGRKGARACRAPQEAWSWTAGLPPAAYTQAEECPDGTMATLARGHDDVVRCMPL
jgi:hypothetical protein